MANGHAGKHWPTGMWVALDTRFHGKTVPVECLDIKVLAHRFMELPTGLCKWDFRVFRYLINN